MNVPLLFFASLSCEPYLHLGRDAYPRVCIFILYGTFKIERVLQPTVPAEARSPPRVGNIGHVTRISNKLVQMGSNSDIQTNLQVFFKTRGCHPFLLHESVCKLIAFLLLFCTHL